MSKPEPTIDQYLETMWHNLNQWDQSVAKAEEIISHNQLILNQFQAELAKENELTPKVQKRLGQIIAKTKQLSQRIQLEKNRLLKEMKQTDKKGKVIGGYMAHQQGSVFIDKDF